VDLQFLSEFLKCVAPAQPLLVHQLQIECHSILLCGTAVCRVCLDGDVRAGHDDALVKEDAVIKMQALLDSARIPLIGFQVGFARGDVHVMLVTYH
jgi:hypothetical protein